jgi:hypothetical protein
VGIVVPMGGGEAKPPPDDLAGLIEAAQADFAAAAASVPLRRDPYRGILAGLSATLGVFGKSITRWERAVADVIASRDPLPAADRAALVTELVAATKQGAFEAMRTEAKRMVRTLDQALVVRIGLCVGGAYVLGVLSVLGFIAIFHLGPYSRAAESDAAWRDLVQNNPDPRPALGAGEIRADRVTGRRYYAGVSLWLEPARPPPAAAAKP